MQPPPSESSVTPTFPPQGVEVNFAAGSRERLEVLIQLWLSSAGAEVLLLRGSSGKALAVKDGGVIAVLEHRARSCGGSGVSISKFNSI